MLLNRVSGSVFSCLQYTLYYIRCVIASHIDSLWVADSDTVIIHKSVVEFEVAYQILLLYLFHLD